MTNRAIKWEGRKGHRALTHGGGAKKWKKAVANRKARRQERKGEA